MTTITALPTPPTRDDPINFADRADTFLAALPTFATETNTVASEINTKHNDVMSAEIIAYNVRGQWTTATLYSQKDIYTDNGISYLVVVLHTSTSIAADLASGKVTIHQGITKSELAAPDGSTKVGYKHTALADPTTVEAALRAELTNVNLHFIAGESDHTGMFNRASAAARRVYVPAGTYDISSANFPANTEFFGDGEGVTIIQQKSGAQYAFSCDSGSNLIANNIKNLKLTNIQLRGTCDTDGFSEHVHSSISTACQT